MRIPEGKVIGRDTTTVGIITMRNGVQIVAILHVHKAQSVCTTCGNGNISQQWKT